MKNCATDQPPDSKMIMQKIKEYSTAWLKEKILYDPVTEKILLAIQEKTEKHKNFTNEDLQEFIKKRSKINESLHKVKGK